MRQATYQSAYKIKDKKLEIPYTSLNIITKNKEKQHVSYNMHPTSMHKHARQQSSPTLPMHNIARDSSILLYKRLLATWRQRNLI
jgi:hypothetical protein